MRGETISASSVKATRSTSVISLQKVIELESSDTIVWWSDRRTRVRYPIFSFGLFFFPSESDLEGEGSWTTNDWENRDQEKKIDQNDHDS